MAKKIAIYSLLACLISSVFSTSIYASDGLIKPNSKLYFLQTWKENILLSLSFTNENKFSYLLSLTEKRVEEMKNYTNPAVTNLYEKHYQYLDSLAGQMDNKEKVAERIRENSLRQQTVLAEVYVKVPDQAKEAILNAQENSSKHVAKTIEKVEGPQKAQAYIQQVATIQQVEKIGQIQQMEQAPMEGSPNGDPSKSIPKELKGTNPGLPGQNLNEQNPGLPGQAGGNKMEPAAPVEKNETMGL